MTLALILVAATALGGCRDEDGRPLAFEAGEYGGPAMPTPPADAAKGWSERTQKMKY
jgi:hypothetical protein